MLADEGDPVSTANVLAYNAEDRYEIASLSEYHNFPEMGLILRPLIEHHPVHCPQPKELHLAVTYEQDWPCFFIYDITELLKGGEAVPTSWISKETRILMKDLFIFIYYLRQRSWEEVIFSTALVCEQGNDPAG